MSSTVNGGRVIASEPSWPLRQLCVVGQISSCCLVFDYMTD